MIGAAPGTANTPRAHITNMAAMGLLAPSTGPWENPLANPRLQSVCGMLESIKTWNKCLQKETV